MWEGGSRQGSGARNEDRWFTAGNVAGVIDGATSEAHNGGWYAEHLTRALRDHLTDDADQPLPVLLRSAINTVARGHGLTPGRSPSAAVALARVNAEDVERLTLCDCSAVVLAPGAAPAVLCDQRLDEVVPHLRAAIRQRLAEGSGYDEEHRRLMAELRHHEEHARNREGGYWVAEATPEAAEHALTLTLPWTAGTRVVLASDGAASAVDLYRSHTWPDLATGAIGATLANIAALEDSDPDARRWPRSKRADDKTITRSTVGENFLY